jgi:hypothetical protein
MCRAAPLTPTLSPLGRGSGFALVSSFFSLLGSLGRGIDWSAIGLPLPNGERVGVRGSREY